ncbi:MAG TPA: hypothetical protein DHW02_15625 [Ktedonobacter sp.]|nr:hypothetical protein [Ktedonobacter sp.]
MALEDFLDPEVAATAVVVAAVVSPQGRKIIRRGAVYGLAGILVAGDAIASVGKSVGRGVQAAGVAASQAASNVSQRAQAATAATTNTTTPPQPTSYTTETTHTTHTSDTPKRTGTRNTAKPSPEDAGGQAE